MMEAGAQQKGIPRTVEVLLSISGLIASSPLLLITAVLIRIGSKGPVLFRQQRVGRGGKLFTLFKFRTMSTTQAGPLITAANDTRVTPIGRVLRKTKIDELPELWNVVIGEMSFVGPRPEVPDLVDLDDVRWNEVLSSRPGITDPVTLSLRNEERFLSDIPDKEKFYSEVLQPYKLDGYIKYLRKRTFATDIGVLIQTLKAIVMPHTATPPTPEEMISRRSQNADAPTVC